MTDALIDTSVIIDHLRGHAAATDLLVAERAAGSLHASEMTRLEVLTGMRGREEAATRSLLALFAWHPVDEAIAEEAGVLGRRWRASHHTIDGADLAIAATGIHFGLRLLTRNVRHFPMFEGLRAPY